MWGSHPLYTANLSGDNFINFVSDDEVIVVDFGATKIQAGHSSFDEPFLWSTTPTLMQQAIQDLQDMIVQIRSQSIDQSIATIVGMPGLVFKDGAIGKAIYSPIHDINLQELLRKNTKINNIWVVNDAKLQALGAIKMIPAAEHHLHISLGTGVGGAITYNAKLWHGVSGLAGEIGHVPLPNLKLTCPCGLTGCLDTLLSGHNLTNMFGESWWKKKDQPVQRNHFKRASKHFVNLLNTLNQFLGFNTITVSGHLAKNKEFSKNVIREVKHTSINLILLEESNWDLSCIGARYFASQLN